jgi:hypothetical protein
MAPRKVSERVALARAHGARRRKEAEIRQKLRFKAATAEFLKKKADAQREAAAMEEYRLDPRAVAIDKSKLTTALEGILRQLGFTTYQDYLRSQLWMSIRRRVLAFYDGRCKDCGGKATQIHHYRYNRDNLSGKSLHGLYALCRPCHCKRHGISYRRLRGADGPNDDLALDKASRFR